MALQTAWPSVACESLCDFTIDPEFRARVAFLHGANWYVGSQYTSVAADFSAWDFWRFGRWRGPASTRAVPANLRVNGTTLSGSEAHEYAAASSGVGLQAQCELLYMDALIYDAMVEYRVYGSSGLVHSGNVTISNSAAAWNLPTLTNGSYALWCRLINLSKGSISWEQYKTLTGVAVAEKYVYTEDSRQFYWDTDRNLGRMPADTSSQLYAARDAVVLAGTQLDRPEWADYITSATSMSGEWSLLRLQVGGGSWSLGTDPLPAPGYALYSKAVLAGTVGGMDPVPFDIAARSVSAACVLRDGTLFIAGNRASRSGPQLALWSFDGTSWTLLGLNPNLSYGMCECSLSDHTCGSILEAADGTVYVLTKCSMHKYDANGPLIIDRLPNFPASTAGEPGGQCLQEYGHSLYWLTEYFGGQQGSGTAWQFYNTLESLALRSTDRHSGVGTVTHNPNSITLYRGGLIGVVQDKPFSDATALARLAYIDGATWDDAPPSWSAETIILQGLESAQGTLFCSGVERYSELPLAALMDPGGADGDERLQFAKFPYRVAQMTRVVNNGNEEIVLIGKRVTSPTTKPDNLGYSLVRIPINGSLSNGLQTSGGFYKICLTWATDRFKALKSVFVAAGVDITKLPAYMTFATAPGTIGYWIPATAAPGSGPYLQKAVTSTEVQYLLHGTAPYSTDIYSRICHTFSDDSGGSGGYWQPDSGIDNAQDAKDNMPVGTKYQCLKITATRPWRALQVDDADPAQPLAANMAAWPCLWLCLGQLQKVTGTASGFLGNGWTPQAAFDGVLVNNTSHAYADNGDRHLNLVLDTPVIPATVKVTLAAAGHSLSRFAVYGSNSAFGNDGGYYNTEPSSTLLGAFSGIGSAWATEGDTLVKTFTLSGTTAYSNLAFWYELNGGDIVILDIEITPAEPALEQYNLRVPIINDNGRYNLPREIAPGETIRVCYLWPPTLGGSAYSVKSYTVQPLE